MIKIISLFLLTNFILTSKIVFASKKQIEFQIGILQPFSVEDTQDSNIYKSGFEAALFYNLGLYAEKFSQCGYIPKYKFQYFPHEDTPKLKYMAKSLEDNEIWFVLGPNKSDQFLNAAKAMRETIMISGMANSEDIINLNWPFYTMYPSNKKLAAVTYYWVKRNREYMGEYGVVTDPSCIFCEDFIKNYSDKAGKPAFIYETSEELFQSKKLEKYLTNKKIISMLLPVYSSFSGKIISSLNNKNFSHIKFIANDGLGDELNHVSYYPIGYNQEGFSIRLGPIKSDTLKILKMENMHISWNNVTAYPPDEAIYFKETLNKISDILCKYRPKSKEDFNNSLKKYPNTIFQSNLGFGVFEFKGKKFYFKELLNFNHDYE